MVKTRASAKLLAAVCCLAEFSVGGPAQAQPAPAEAKAEAFRAAAASVLTDEQLALVLKFGYERKRLMDRLMDSRQAQYKSAGLSDRDARDKCSWRLGG